jgi:16S rRNA (guanine966-N2)-methyltransferase
LTGVTKIWRRDATSLGDAGTLQPFDLVFCDPPYGKGLGELALASAAAGGWVANGAIAVLEELADSEIAWPPPFQEIDRRHYGDTVIALAKAAS